MILILRLNFTVVIELRKVNDHGDVCNNRHTVKVISVPKRDEPGYVYVGGSLVI